MARFYKVFEDKTAEEETSPVKITEKISAEKTQEAKTKTPAKLAKKVEGETISAKKTSKTASSRKGGPRDAPMISIDVKARIAFFESLSSNQI